MIVIILPTDKPPRWLIQRRPGGWQIARGWKAYMRELWAGIVTWRDVPVENVVYRREEHLQLWLGCLREEFRRKVAEAEREFHSQP